MRPFRLPAPRAAGPGRGDAALGSPARAADAAILLAAGLAAALSLDGTDALLAAAWAPLALWVVRTDLDRFIIPDAASAGIAALGLLRGALQPWPEGAGATIAALAEGIGRGAVAAGLFWLVAALYRRRAGREGLGFGDVKLAGASAVWLTALGQVSALEVACLAALATVLAGGRGRTPGGTAVPFGAFLAPAAWLAFVAAPWLDALAGRLA